jgi:cell division protein FtsQ
MGRLGGDGGFEKNPRAMPAAAKTVPVKSFSLRTNGDGVLDAQWLKQALALPKGASLMELDLQQLRTRLLAYGQVNAASLTLNFPDTLEVRISERSPIVRVRAQVGSGEERTLLVARDGVVYEGIGYEAARLEELPWLSGAKLARTGNKYEPIDGMSAVADLLAQARLNAEPLYRMWQVVSLARLRSDHEIEVRTKPGTVVVFGADGDFAVQLAKLDYQWETLSRLPAPVAKIDLSLGREVPVTFESAAAKPAAPSGASAKNAPNIRLFNPPNPLPRTKREF